MDPEFPLRLVELCQPKEQYCTLGAFGERYCEHYCLEEVIQVGYTSYHRCKKYEAPLTDERSVH
jgi:hypothetical protein